MKPRHSTSSHFQSFLALLLIAVAAAGVSRELISRYRSSDRMDRIMESQCRIRMLSLLRSLDQFATTNQGHYPDSLSVLWNQTGESSNAPVYFCPFSKERYRLEPSSNDSPALVTQPIKRQKAYGRFVAVQPDKFSWQERIRSEHVE